MIDEPKQKSIGGTNHRARPTIVGAALLAAVGIGAGATALAQRTPHVTLIALAPVPVAKLSDGETAVKGKVAEVFSNKFIVADDSGRALVETGRAGEGMPLVAPGESVTVQGHFVRGFIHAAAITHADGHTVMLDPPPPPPAPSLPPAPRPE